MLSRRNTSLDENSNHLCSRMIASRRRAARSIFVADASPYARLAIGKVWSFAKSCPKRNTLVSTARLSNLYIKKGDSRSRSLPNAHVSANDFQGISISFAWDILSSDHYQKTMPWTVPERNLQEVRPRNRSASHSGQMHPNSKVKRHTGWALMQTPNACSCLV